jgi:hypothetical protein
VSSKTTTFSQKDGFLFNPRNPDADACEEILEVRGDSGSGVLTCNLRLPFHKVHHDPRGWWWTQCTLTDHNHQEPREESHGFLESGEQF